MEYMQSGKDLKDRNIGTIAKYSLIPDLKIGVKCYYQKAEDVVVRNINKSCCRDINTC